MNIFSFYQIFCALKETATLYKSALLPLGLQLKCIDNEKPKEKERELRVIFKKGDDLRQDQLITQVIKIIDVLLKRNDLDMHLSPYSVLATNRSEGFIEVVEGAYNLAHVLEKYNNKIRNFFFDHNQSTKELEQCFEKYVRSCGKFLARKVFYRSHFFIFLIICFSETKAAYCVITFVLGIGDRHFDNLLLTTDGRLFHVDFGFILGNDPKPFPPAIRINKEMIEAIGGLESNEYKRFLLFAVQVYYVLRKHSDLIINMFTLMVDAGISNIASAPECIPKLLKKFRLDLDDEAAAEYLVGMIEDSVASLFPEVIEKFHTFAQKRKK